MTANKGACQFSFLSGSWWIDVTYREFRKCSYGFIIACNMCCANKFEKFCKVRRWLNINGVYGIFQRRNVPVKENRLLNLPRSYGLRKRSQSPSRKTETDWNPDASKASESVTFDTAVHFSDRRGMGEEGRRKVAKKERKKRKNQRRKLSRMHRMLSQRCHWPQPPRWQFLDGYYFSLSTGCIISGRIESKGIPVFDTADKLVAPDAITRPFRPSRYIYRSFTG